ncbi:YjiH family protein [Bacillus haynesii]|uniref:YjiH family protein n=1 Tax=Bacillus haynesii TaxID=1925021 RepID=UPI002281D528|nr:YjiH family protein [Bacillus haynesii]MCY8141128.1 YjiH family protein [Bacillus haynesii]MCY8398749.1 YjiH family protein [Bacillus haynesii]MEC1456071.1 YjiH family protein [Bacillus haynesii]MEC1573243.1 YjiH family protein [Bacillus haynesii]
MDKALQKRKRLDLIKFLVPSLIGIILFMIPVKIEGNLTIPIAVFSNALQKLLQQQLPLIMTVIVTATFILTFVTKTFHPAFIKKSEFFYNLLNVSLFWYIVRLFGMIFAVMAYFKIGPEAVYAKSTGGTLLFSLLPVLFSVFLFAGLFLPFLLNFGLLELCGALMKKLMRPVFKLPGRSSIDCMASWLGDGTIGVLLTSKQYEEGFYTKREAAVIGTTFSVVSITFCLVIISQVNLAHMFVPFYLTILLAGAAAAVISPRIPPLSRKADTYITDQADHDQEKIPEGYTPFQWGLSQAVAKAKQNTSVKDFLQDGAKNVLDMWMGVAPVVMALGTAALIVAEYTPVFKWLGLPFIPLLELLQVPEAAEASQTLVVGFADMFLPSVLGSGIESEMTRFIIACVSVTQLIYMSEVGGLLLGSKIPVTFLDLVLIFLVRTLITLPVIVLCAHFIF